MAYDHPLPKIKTITYDCSAPEVCLWLSAGFSVSEGNYADYSNSRDAINLAAKKYLYEFSIHKCDQCMEDFRHYLTGNMRDNTELEIWSIWLGNDFTKHDKHKFPVKNIRFEDITVDYDWYREELYVHYIPQRRKASVGTLSNDDLSFIEKNYGVCLVIRK